VQLQKKAAKQQNLFRTKNLRDNRTAFAMVALAGRGHPDRAELLRQQSVLTAELQIDDYTTEMNDLLGLPSTPKLELDPKSKSNFEPCQNPNTERAWEENPEIPASEAVEKARPVWSAKPHTFPTITAYARHSYQDGVPFLVALRRIRRH